MSQYDDALAAARQQVAAEGVLLEQDGNIAVQEIFDETVGPSLRQGDLAQPPVDHWQNPKTQEFVLGLIRRIASEVATVSGGNPATRELLFEVAERVVTESRSEIAELAADGILLVPCPMTHRLSGS